MSLSSLISIGQSFFELESGNNNVDRQMDGQTNGQNMDKQMDGIKLISIRNIVMMVISLPVKFEFD